MCHTSGSKGSQPHNIQACRLELESLLMKECQASELHADLTSTIVKWRPLLRLGAELAICTCNHGFQWCKMFIKLNIDRGVRNSLEISYKILSNCGPSTARW